MEILVRKKGSRKWDKVGEKRFASEAALQNILYESPGIIPIEKLGEGLKEPKLFIKEAGLPGSGYTDLIGIDEDGVITIIECKLATNTEIRRKVIGQLLEYAAYLWQMPYEEFDEICCKAEKWSEKHLSDIMQDRVEIAEEPWDEDVFRSSISATLQNGDFRLIIAVDALNDELRRITEYINSRGQGSPRIYVLEMTQYETSELQMLVPELSGPSVSVERIAGKAWDEQSFFVALESKVSSDELIVARKLLEWAKANGHRIWWGRGAKYGSFCPVLDHKGKEFWAMIVNTGGYMSIPFQPLQKRPPFDDSNRRMEFLHRLNQIEGIDLPDDAINRYPSVYLSTLTNKNVFKKFIEVLEWFVEEVRSS